LIHETLGRYMVNQGTITMQQCETLHRESVALEKKFGHLLLEKDILDLDGLLKSMQQNLARKLLDGFTFTEGSYELSYDLPAVASPMTVKVPQLVLLGIARFAPQQQVDQAMPELVGQALVLNPQPLNDPARLRLNTQQVALLAALKTPQRIDQLAIKLKLPVDELSRLIWGFTAIGAILPENALAGRSTLGLQAAASPETSFFALASEASPKDDPARRERLNRVVLDYRGKDPFELLEIDEVASQKQVRGAFLSFSRKWAPWEFAVDDQDKAANLFLAGARSYARLIDPEQRERLLEQRRRKLEAAKGVDVEAERKAAKAERFKIKTALLDPDEQFKKGMAMATAGAFDQAMRQLEYACDLDPQNAVYRAELAWCRYRIDPVHFNRMARSELKDALRMDPRCGLAMYYAGEIAMAAGKLDEAEAMLRNSIKPLAPDRRPLDALRTLATLKKK
jgi:hypothetical protein